MINSIYSRFASQSIALDNTESATTFLISQSPRDLLELYNYIFRGEDQTNPTSLSGHSFEKITKPAEREKLLMLISDVLEQQHHPLLNLAASAGYTSLVHQLLMDDQTHAHLSTPDAEGVTPIMAALRSERLEIVSELLSEGAAAALTPTQAQELIYQLTEAGKGNEVFTLLTRGFAIDEPDKQGVRPLHIALAQGNWDLVELFLEHGADPNAPDDSGFTPLHYCFLHGNLGHEGVVACLKAGASFEKFLTALNSNETAGMLDEFTRDESDFLTRAAPYETLSNILYHLEALKRLDKFRKEIGSPISSDVKSIIDNHMVMQVPFTNWRESAKSRPQEMELLNTSRVEGSTTIQGKRDTMTGWEEANVLMLDWAESKTALTKESIGQVNALIDPKAAGIYRTGEITAGGNAIRAYVPGILVETEFDQFLEWLEQGILDAEAQKTNPIELAARAFQYFVSIHPFDNGNGRTSRLVMDYILKRLNLPPAAMGKDINVAIFMLLPKNVSPSSVVMKVYEGILQANRLLNLVHEGVAG